MAEDLGKGRDRYDVSGNVEAQYVDADQTVLVNKDGIRDLPALQLAEEEALSQAYETLLAEVRLDTPMSCDLLRHTHARIFGDLYEWAGRWRTVWISKPGITWPAPDFLELNMQGYEKDVLHKYPASTLQADHDFCAAAGEIQGEFLVIHPFREGNARTIKLLTDLLSLQTGRPLLVYDRSKAGRDRYIAAAADAFKRRYGPLSQVISEALARARKAP